MAKPRSGTIQRTSDGKLRARVTVTTERGTERVWFTLDPKMSDLQARRYASDVAKRMAATTLTDEQLAIIKNTKTSDLTVEKFFWSVYTRLVELRRYQLAHWRHHIIPVIGGRSVRTFGADDLRQLIETLDEKIRTEALSANTARVIWACARKFSRDLSMSKKKELRVRSDNPAATVAGPDGGPNKSNQWLYPDELFTALSAETTPLTLARFVAVQTYLCCRPGEAFGLEWHHIDLMRGMVRIEQTRHADTRKVGPTKGREVRVFPIPKHLAPVLAAMHAESTGVGFVFKNPSRGSELRASLLAAGIDRRELHENSSVNRAMRMHDCRATGISYMALSGATDDAIRERAGHKSFSQTLDYIRRGKLAAGSIGEPFGPLPDRLLGSSTASQTGGSTGGSRIPAGYGITAKQPVCSLDRAVAPRVFAGLDDSEEYSEDDYLAAFVELHERAVVAQAVFGRQSRGDA